MRQIKSVEDARSLGIGQKAIDGAMWDACLLVVQDEFNRPESRTRDGKQPDYRNRAIDRLIEARVEFHTDANIPWEFMRRYVSVTCPYCGIAMDGNGGGGGSRGLTTKYQCKCGASVQIEVPTPHGISVIPPREA